MQTVYILCVFPILYLFLIGFGYNCLWVKWENGNGLNGINSEKSMRCGKSYNLKIEKKNYNQTVIKSTFIVFLSLKVKNHRYLNSVLKQTE